MLEYVLHKLNVQLTPDVVFINGAVVLLFDASVVKLGAA